MRLELGPCPAEVPWSRTAHVWVQGWSVPDKELGLFPLGGQRARQGGEAWPKNAKTMVGDRVHSANTWPMPPVTPPRASDAGRAKGTASPSAE